MLIKLLVLVDEVMKKKGEQFRTIFSLPLAREELRKGDKLIEKPKECAAFVYRVQCTSLNM